MPHTNDERMLPSLTVEDVRALQLPVGPRVRLDPKLRTESLSLVRFWDQDCACFGTSNGNEMENTPFFNREVERGFLIEPRNQFVILDGPAGYGKSYLLASVARTYKTEKRFKDKWAVVSVCLKTAQSGRQNEWLIDAIARQLELELRTDSNRTDIALLEIANRIKQEARHLLILLDGLEQCTGDELIWLRYKLPHQLRSVLDTDVRVIISGRHINSRINALGNISGQVRQEERRLSFEVCKLSAFDNGVVRSIVNWYMKPDDLATPPAALIDCWIDEICYLSGGHPEAIVELVNDLIIKTKWGWTLQDRRFIPEIVRQELFQRCLRGVANNVLGRTLEDIRGPMLSGPNSPAVTNEVLGDLETLVLLRRFEASLLAQLHRLNLLSTEPSLLQGLLVGKGLSGGIDPITGWQESAGVPVLLALQQRYEAKTRVRCLETHRSLHKVFHNRAMGLSADGSALPRSDRWRNATNILLSIFESLHHFLNGIEDAPQSQDQFNELETQLTNLMIQYLRVLEPYCDDGHVALERLWGGLNSKNQVEIRFLACWLLGDIWPQIYDKLKNRLELSAKLSPQADSMAVKQSIVVDSPVISAGRSDSSLVKNADEKAPSPTPKVPHAVQSQQDLSWLHLSDLHFQSTQTYNRNVVLNALLKDIEEHMQNGALRPDFIVVTGDIAHSGQVTEYALAKRFLDELLQKTGLAKERLFVVPGNHDVDRNLVSNVAKAIRKAIEGRDSANNSLCDRQSRQILMERFKGYANFIREYFASLQVFDDDNYYYVRNMDLSGTCLAVLGLNSAWLCESDDDRINGLMIGEQQTRDALDKAQHADLRMALLHHPFSALSDFDQRDSAAILTDRCDFVLHGHLHHGAVTQLNTPDSHAMVIAGGACYETREHPNLYNWVCLNPATHTGMISLRRYSDERGGFWAKDTQTYKNAPDGRYEFKIPPSTHSAR